MKHIRETFGVVFLVMYHISCITTLLYPPCRHSGLDSDEKYGPDADERPAKDVSYKRRMIFLEMRRIGTLDGIMAWW